MTDTTYNGWANYETWNVALWLTNDQCLYGAMTQFARYTNPFLSFRNELVHSVFGFIRTPDGVALNHPSLDIVALDMVVKTSGGNTMQGTCAMCGITSNGASVLY